MKKIVFYGEGSVGVSIDNDRLLIKKLGGKSPDVTLLFPIMDAAYPDWKKEGEKLHRGRINPWKITVHRGLSGAKDFRLRYLEDENFGYFRTGGVIHVSMYERLNWDIIFTGWLGDFVPIVAEMVNEYPAMVQEGIRLAVSDGDFEDWKQPGVTSGLKENIEKISRAREIMMKI
ncbi:hypothetical protein [Thermicanus aegyptius]|uniref:hypothetical protein n=1 Tax=Thermicanus aegyptius TaxID=94009 RepID=UPI0012EC50F9|nr:hypothetical protein [Thermicanus aegyptius]